MNIADNSSFVFRVFDTAFHRMTGITKVNMSEEAFNNASVMDSENIQ